ncbi:hypothetical protein L6452_28712 [Arctium lappa]|uniref:Uncharacterized protein n=1 Tax=Arctium lappa TaxID=4217 RepID=A0ACB8ZZ89_ARCLA|nr:hypothetical protein L6452_28712 [Arctium lappa]
MMIPIFNKTQSDNQISVFLVHRRTTTGATGGDGCTMKLKLLRITSKIHPFCISVLHLSTDSIRVLRSIALENSDMLLIYLCLLYNYVSLQGV